MKLIQIRKKARKIKKENKDVRSGLIVKSDLFQMVTYDAIFIPLYDHHTFIIIFIVIFRRFLASRLPFPGFRRRHKLSQLDAIFEEVLFNWVRTTRDLGKSNY